MAEKFIRKGTQVFIEGKLRTRSWTDQTGNKRFTTEITVDNLQLLGKKSDNPGAQPAQGGYQQPAQPSYQQPAQPAYQPPVQPVQPVQQEPMDISLADNPTDDLPF